MTKGSKLNVRKFLGLVSTFVEVKGKNWYGEGGGGVGAGAVLLAPYYLNRVKTISFNLYPQFSRTEFSNKSLASDLLMLSIIQP